MSVHVNTTTVYTANQVNDRLTNVNRNLRKEIDQARRDAVVQANRIADERTRRDRQKMQSWLNKEISSQNAEIRKLDNEQKERLNRIAGQIYDDIAKNVGKLDAKIDKTAQIFRTEISNLGKWTAGRLSAQQSEIDSINKSVQDLFDHIAVGQNKSVEAVKATRMMYDEAIKVVDLEKFMPVETRRILLNLEQIERDPQASLNQARMTYTDIIIAREEALKKQIVFGELLSRTREMLELVMEIVHHNRVVHVKDNGETADIETNFWTRGEYSHAEHELETLKKELTEIEKSRDGEASMKRLDEIIARISELEKTTDELVASAVKNAILSEKRMEISDDIITSLQRQGYEVKSRLGEDEVGYLGGEDRPNDWREGVYAVLTRGEEEYTILIRPDGNDNKISFHRNDGRRMTEREYIEAVDRFLNEIRRAGYDFGAQTCETRVQNRVNILANPSELGKTGAAGEVKTAIGS